MGVLNIIQKTQTKLFVLYASDWDIINPSIPHLFPIYSPSIPHLFPIYSPSIPHLFPISIHGEGGGR